MMRSYEIASERSGGQVLIIEQADGPGELLDVAVAILGPHGGIRGHLTLGDLGARELRAAVAGLETVVQPASLPPCKRCGQGFGPDSRAWAIVWDGERYWIQVRYLMTTPVGPYHTGCTGQELNERNAIGYAVPLGVHTATACPACGKWHDQAAADALNARGAGDAADN